MNTAHKIRASFVFLFFCSLYAIILINLYSIQIRQRNFFKNLGKQQYNISIKCTPERALIYDRNSQPLAMNKMAFSAFILPKKIESIEAVEQFLKKYFPQALERWYQHQHDHFMFVKRRLTDAQIQLIKESNIADIKLLKEPSRFYPVESAGHIVGITDVDNIGLFGTELLFNRQLAGKPTMVSLEKDARFGHFYFSKNMKEAGSEGSPITLTIDADLQFLAYENLQESINHFNAQEGAVLIMNPTNGDILAMAQWPSFDANNTESLNIADTKNRCVTDVYELGSVMKVFVALAALEEGVVTPNELIDCKNSKTALVNGFQVNTWKAHGLIPFYEVIQSSNNIGIAQVAQRLGPKLYDHYKQLGFGSKTALSWPGQQTGFVNPPQNWSKRSLISLSFGYEVTAHLLQLAQAFCMIANNGYTIAPRLVLNPLMPTPTENIGPLYSSASITTISEILERTVTHGTAYHAALKGFTVRGKTGTANLVIDGSYAPDHNTFAFAGIIEKDDYKRVIVTFIKDIEQKNLYASTVAVPLFEKVAENVLIHDKIFKKGKNK
jgi:cell division protein FtsI/penicillin-binding protein 2